MSTRLEHTLIVTQFGAVAFAGRLQTDPIGPPILVITGLYPPKGHMHDLVERFPASEMVVAQLPGMISPTLPVNTVEAMGVVFRQAVTRLWPDRRPVVVAFSTGCMVAAQLDAAALVLVEPLFHTGEHAELAAFMRDNIRNDTGTVIERYSRELLGIDLETTAGLDKRYMLKNVTCPLWVLVGGRRTPPWGSLTTDADRAALEARGARFVSGPPTAGHGVADTPEGRAILERMINEALAATKA